MRNTLYEFVNDSWTSFKFESRLWRTGLIIFSALLIIPAVWFLLSHILGVTQGFGLKDEGLYLLAADPPTSLASWGFPFGWHTRPLFAAVGYDIAAFRTLGAVILVATAGLLGWSVARVMNVRGIPHAKALYLGAVTTSIAGSLFYYIPMLRTPSYNWLNLVGIQIALAAFFAALANMRAASSSNRDWRNFLLPLAIALGLFITIPAKPSTFPILFVLMTVAFIFCFGFRSAVTWITSVLIFILVWLALALASGLWPWDFIDVFSRAIDVPPPSESQTIIGAVGNIANFPQELLAYATGLTKQELGLTFSAICILIMPLVARRKWTSLRLIGFSLAVLAALSINGFPVPLLSSREFVAGWLAPERTVAGLLVLFSALLAVQGLSRNFHSALIVNSPTRIVVPLLLMLSPFLFAFGSGSGLLQQSGVAAGFLYLAAVAIVSPEYLDRTRLYYFAIISFSVIAISVSGLKAGWESPYDTPALTDQVVEMPIGSHGAPLKISTDESASLNFIRAQAEGSGWSEGTPLIDVSYTWHPGIVYFLGGQVPNSLMMTIFGYSESQAIFDFNLKQEFDFADSWLITSSPESLDEAGKNSTAIALTSLTNHSGHPFPEGYDCISAGAFQLWKPIADMNRKAQNCGS